MREYAFEQCSNMSEYAWNRILINCKLSSIYRYISIDTYLESCQASKRSKKERHAKIIIDWNYLPKTLQYVHRDLNTVGLLNIPGFWYATDYEYVWVPNMPGFIKEVNVGASYFNFWLLITSSGYGNNNKLEVLNNGWYIKEKAPHHIWVFFGFSLC